VASSSALVLRLRFTHLGHLGLGCKGNARGWPSARARSRAWSRRALQPATHQEPAQDDANEPHEQQTEGILLHAGHCGRGERRH
jgi:hypothetical protein